MQGLSIRQAGVEDAATIAELFSEFNAILGADGLSGKQAFLPQNVEVSAARMRLRLQRIVEVEQTLLAAVEGEPAGLACVRLVPYIGQDAPYAEVTQLYVRPRFQRRGVGAALVLASEQLALDAGATSVHIVTGVDNHGAQAFYRAAGYGMPCVSFEKILTPAAESRYA
jgi:GNAT superfamily N-acetyltransferase